MTEKVINNGKVKNNFIYNTSKFALISFIMGFFMIIVTIISYIWFANYGSKPREILFTIILSILIISGILGSVFAGMSFRKKVTVIGILALIFGIFLCIWNALGLFILYNDAWFIMPYESISYFI